jgi:hemerythrin superfamily protein
MSEAAHDLAKAAELPEGDVIRLLLEQHARIRTLFATVKSATDHQHKADAFNELRALLAVHETAEEMVLRPVSRRTASAQVAEARNEEEAEANEVLAQLEKLDVDSTEFDTQFAEFEKSVDAHAEAEEHEEFPAIVTGTGEEDRQRWGKFLTAAEKTAPTHPHPAAAGSTTAQFTAGPFAAMVDRTKDALHNLMK